MNWDRILFIQVLEELLQVFMIFVGWIIKCTPFAIISLIAAAIGGQSDISEIMTQIGYLLAAIMVGLLIQLIVVYCGMYAFFVRKNPIPYLKQMVPAFTMAFACASSAATLPVTIDCVIGSGTPVGIARFVLPLGATSKCRYTFFSYEIIVFQFVLILDSLQSTWMGRQYKSYVRVYGWHTKMELHQQLLTIFF